MNQTQLDYQTIMANKDKFVYRGVNVKTVSITATLRKIFGSNQCFTRGAVMQQVIQDLGLSAKAAKNTGTGLTIEGDFEKYRLPGVYAVENLKTGFMYIGQSRRPDLRRATHYFWLRNIDTPKSSNIFYGSKKLREDLAKYGPDSFRLRILKSFDIDCLDSELVKEEARQIKKCKQLYNVSSNKDRYYHPLIRAQYERLHEIDAELKKTQSQIRKYQLTIAKLREEGKPYEAGTYGKKRRPLIHKKKALEIERAQLHGEIRGLRPWMK